MNDDGGLSSFLRAKRNTNSLSDSKPGAVWVEGVAESTNNTIESIRDTSNGATYASSSYHNSHCNNMYAIPEGSDLDPDALAALPDDIKCEVIEKELERLGQDSNVCMGNTSECNVPEGSNLDPIALVGLSDDILREVLEQESQRLEQEHSQMDSWVYEGEQDSNGRKHGDGIIRWPNGDKFEGVFRHGFRDGFGTLKQTDGTFYSGGWKNDLFDGYGTMHFPDGSTYTGHFQNNKYNGQGRCIFSNGDSYTGNWENGFMTGFGTYTHACGEQFEGTYKNNRRHGPGKYMLNNRKIDVIRYNKGMRVGYGVRWTKNETKAYLIRGKTRIRKISVEQGKLMTKKVLADVINQHVDNLEHHIPRKEKKRTLCSV